MVYSDMKIYSKCKLELSETSFYKSKSNKDGLRSSCKSCSNNDHKKRVEQNYDRTLEISRNDYYRHKEKRQESNKRWRTDPDNKDTVVSGSKRWRAENPEKLREYTRRHYLKYKEQIYSYQTAWRHSPGGMERLRILNRIYRENDPERFRATQRRWKERNKDKTVTYSRNRQALFDGAEGSFTERDWAEIKDKYNHRCLMCLKQEPDITLTVDHIVPLSCGGTNWPNNIQPLCRSCNSSKGPKYIELRYDHLLMGATVNAI